MNVRFLLWVVATTGFFSCGDKHPATPEKINRDADAMEAVTEIHTEELSTDHYNKFVDTQYVYTDSAGTYLSIQNSFPKGGQNYTDPAGNTFVYTIFWTRITNESSVPLVLTLDIPKDPITLPSSMENSFRVLLSSETMSPDKESSFNYGLRDLGSSLEKGLYTAPFVLKTIDPKGAYTFYVITLFDKRVEGVVRAGFSLKEQDLFYRVNNKEIHSGQIRFQK